MKISQQQQQQQQQGRKTESCASSLLHIWIFLAPLREINVLLFLPLCSVVDKYRSSCAFSPRCCMVCGNARLYRGKQRQQKWIVSSCCMGAQHRVKSTSLILEEDRNRKEPQQALGTLFFCLSCRRRFESSPSSQTADAMFTPNTAAVVWAETS